MYKGSISTLSPGCGGFIVFCKVGAGLGRGLESKEGVVEVIGVESERLSAAGLISGIGCGKVIT